jgi:hypothetical protein
MARVFPAAQGLLANGRWHDHSKRAPIREGHQWRGRRRTLSPVRHPRYLECAGLTALFIIRQQLRYTAHSAAKSSSIEILPMISSGTMQ